MADIKRITKRDDLVALQDVLGVSPDWHEPDEQMVTATVHGSEFDNAGYWGSDLTLDDVITDGMEQWVVLYQDGKPVAEINLATLFAFATGHQG
jgi:hypothetical protein